MPSKSKKSKVYVGAVVEKGATSMSITTPSPAIRWMVEQGHIKPGDKVLDYGAGKTSRNADYLRSLGCKVYAYDPYNGERGADGFAQGKVSTYKPRGKFDVAFSSYVLNVVRCNDESSIVSAMKHYAPVVFHVTRSEKALTQIVKRAVQGKVKNRALVDWLKPKFPLSIEKIRANRHPKDALIPIAQHGFKTGAGKFQRLVKAGTMRGRGYRNLRAVADYDIWCRGCR